MAVVHRTEDVGVAVFPCAFILHRTAWVLGLHPIVSIFKVLSVASFVAKAPEDNRWMVEVALHIALIALQVSQIVVGALGKGLITVAHSVRFDVGLGHNIDAVFIAEVIPDFVVWIVASAHGVDVVFLHYLEVLNHSFTRYAVSSVRVELVAVGAFEEHRLAVDENL